MITAALFLLAAAGPIDCPPIGTPARDRLKFAGAVCKDDEAERLLKEREAERFEYERTTFERRGKAFADRQLPASMQAAIRHRMDADLYDGLSARYRWAAWRHPDLYCFEINAKNRLGAYTGWSEYAVTILPNGKIGDPADPYDCRRIK